MTPADVAKVLAKIAAYDQRTVGQADVAAWHEILAPYPLGEALQAVMRHHRDSTERIKPAHVVAHIRAIRTEQAKATSEALALPSRYEHDPARAGRVAAGMATVGPVLEEIRRRIEADRQPQGELDPGEQIRQRALQRAAEERRPRRLHIDDGSAA